jgi:hypothetical protein
MNLRNVLRATCAGAGSLLVLAAAALPAQAGGAHGWRVFTVYGKGSQDIDPAASPQLATALVAPTSAAAGPGG